MSRQATLPNEHTDGDAQGHQGRQTDPRWRRLSQVNTMMARATSSAAKMTARCIIGIGPGHAVA
jgi:hypothetical protein